MKIWTNFSSRTIYDRMSEEHKILYGQVTKPKQHLTSINNNNKMRTKLQNKVRESSIDDTNSNTKSLPINYEVKEIETTTSKDVTKDFKIPTITTTAINANTETQTTAIDQNEQQEEQQQLIKDQDEYIKQYDELEITKQMLYKQRQENRYLINEIRQLRNLDPQSITISHEKEEEAIEDEKINLSVQNNTKKIAKDIGKLIVSDGNKIIEFIEYWDQMKRLFRELVEIELYKILKENPNQKLSIQDAIYNILYYLEDDVMKVGKRVKFPDGLTRYISEYFIDQKTEKYLRIKFQTPRKNKDTLGFEE
jgi:hypothetical protein